MKDIQNNVIDSLKSNGCNISDAIKKNNCSLEEFYSYLLIDEFKAGYNEAKQLADDFARTQFMKLIQKGEKSAIIEYQKMLRQSDDANESRRIRREVMSVFIRTLESKAMVLKEFCGCFSTSKSSAEEFYKTVLTEGGLTSPFERKKQRSIDDASSMTVMFKSGKLDELDMY